MAEGRDVTTGLTSTQTSQLAREPTYVGETAYTGGRTDVQAGTSREVSSQVQNQVASQLNTTPQALAALHSLIASLTERPAISEEELALKTPLTKPVYQNGQWQYLDPVSGRTMGFTEAQQLNAYRASERQRIVQQAGTIPAGTPEQQRVFNERMTEIQRSRTQQGDYSKAAAFGDAQALINKSIADAMRTAMPQITAASEGAGTSKGTFRALATQEAATRGGIEGAALGANLGVQYGQIFNQLEATLEALTRQDPNGPAGALIQALNVAKGISTQGTTSTATTGTKTGTQQSTTQVGPETKTSQKNIEYNQRPMAAQPLPMTPAEPFQPQVAKEPVMYIAKGPTLPPEGQPTTFDANAAYTQLASSAYSAPTALEEY